MPKPLNAQQRSQDDDSYEEAGLRVSFWSSRGGPDDERFPHLAEPHLDDVKAWLAERGLGVTELGS